VPQNSEVNQEFGVYKSQCCGAEIVIGHGATFPDCPNHRKLATRWNPVEEDKTIRLIDTNGSVGSVYGLSRMIASRTANPVCGGSTATER
jgi:hypothetical protein